MYKVLDNNERLFQIKFLTGTMRNVKRFGKILIRIFFLTKINR